MLFDLNSQINSLLIQVSVDTTLKSLMIVFNVFLCLLNSRFLSFFEHLHKICSSIGRLKHIEFNPSCEISRSAFYPSFQIVSIVFSPADDRKNKVSLTQVFILHTFWDFIHDWHHNEVKKHVENHVSPVSRGWVRCSNTEGNDQNQTECIDHPTAYVIHQNFPSIIFDHRWCNWNSVDKFSICDFFSRKVWTIKSLLWLSGKIFRLEHAILDVN